MQRLNISFDLSGIRVLVVDSDPDTRLLFKFLFEEHDAEVVAVESTDEALSIIKQLKIHLLISDIFLPGKDGYSLIRSVRNLDAEDGGRTPAIAVTGTLTNVSRFRRLPTSFDLYFTKPVDLEELLSAAVNLTKQLEQKT